MKYLISKSMVCAALFAAPFGMADKTYTSGEFKNSVVELYTSEGCSSCPPADEFLSKLGKTKEADRIIPLAYHVDYWDYIGWKDPFAKAKFTKRQRKVAKVNNQRSIYTPEFVVDGAEARGGRGITGQLEKAQKQAAEAGITLNLSGEEDTWLANIEIDNITYEGKEKPQVYVAVYESGLKGYIDAGENRGRTLEHDYVVRYLSKAERTKNGKLHQFKLKLDPDWNRNALGISVVVELADSRRTLQALKGVL